MEDSPKKVVALRAVNRPQENHAVLVSSYDDANESGTIFVLITKDDPNTDSIYVKLYDIGDPAPTSKPMDAAIVPLQGGSTSVFEDSTFLIEGVPSEAPNAVNKFLWYWGYDSSNNLNEEGGPVNFVAVPQTCTGTVQATHCLWFTYASASDKTTTYGEYGGTGSPYTPFAVRVPDEATTVNISADGSWAHGDTTKYTSDPDGRTGQSYPLNSTWAGEYTGLPSASHILGIDTELGKLVGLREYSNSGTNTDEFAIGKSTSNIVLNDGDGQPHRIRLGLHDGFEWSNNTGSMEVTIEWVE